MTPLEPAMLAEIFRAHARAAPSLANDELEARLAGILAAARAAWPGVALAPAAFVRHLAARLPADAEVAAALASVHGADLYLACACLHGDAAALAAFEERLMPRVDAVLGRLRLTDDLADDVKQALRVRLFTDGDGAAHGGAYAGHGPLAGFVQVAAVRLAASLQRRRKTHGLPQGGAALERGAAGPDPEIGYLKTRYAAEFSAAFRAALGTLTSRERNLLRLHFMDGLNIDALGELYGVHRATVARWIGRAREALLTETRRLLEGRLQLARGDLDSLMDLVRSRVEVSLATALSHDGEP